MTDRIDHATEARRLIELASIPIDTDSAIAVSNAAQVHATLALVEQQRIANLIALAAHLPADDAGISAFGALVQGADDNRATIIRPDIAAALGVAPQ